MLIYFGVSGVINNKWCFFRDFGMFQHRWQNLVILERSDVNGASGMISPSVHEAILLYMKYRCPWCCLMSVYVRNTQQQLDTYPSSPTCT